MRLVHIISVGKNGGTNIIQKYYNYLLVYKKLNIDYHLIVLCSLDTDILNFRHPNITFLQFKTSSDRCFLKRLWLQAIKELQNTLEHLKFTHIILRVDFIDKTIFNFVNRYKPILEYPTPPIEKTSIDRPFYHQLAIKYNKNALKKSLLNLTVIDVNYPNCYLFHNSLLNQHSKKTDHTLKQHINILFMSSKYAKDEYNGYDRFLSGMREYLQTDHEYSFTFFIAGDDKEGFESMLDSHLKKYIEIQYLGFQTIAELNQLIPSIDVGINDLAFHRKGLQEANTLKTIDFLAWRIPFLISHKDVNIKSEDSYYLKVPEDESAIKIQDMIEFLNQITNDDILQMEKNAQEITLEERIKEFIKFLNKEIDV